MPLPPEIHERWQTNMRAAGIEPDAATIERIAGRSVAERINDLYGLLERLGYSSENPDFLRDVTAGAEMEVGSGRK